MTKSATRVAADKVTFTQTEVTSAVALKAPIASPSFTGGIGVTGSTAHTAGDITNSISGSYKLFGANGTAGSTAYVTYAFEGDNNTGMYHPAADTVGLVAGGTVSLKIDNTGAYVGGKLQQNEVNTYSLRGYANTNVNYHADFQIRNSGGGNVALVEAIHSHHSLVSYGTSLLGWYVFYNGVLVSENTISDITTNNGGSFSVTSSATGTLRVTHNAGAYAGPGDYYIKVTSPKR